MSQVIKLSIPDGLADRIEEKRGDQSVQEYTLAALRSAVHGSPVEAELRRQIGELLDLLRHIGHGQAIEHTIPAPIIIRGPTQQGRPEDKRIGW